jgi:hypothetical protein
LFYGENSISSKTDHRNNNKAFALYFLLYSFGKESISVTLSGISFLQKRCLYTKGLVRRNKTDVVKKGEVIEQKKTLLDSQNRALAAERKVKGLSRRKKGKRKGRRVGNMKKLNSSSQKIRKTS